MPRTLMTLLVADELPGAPVWLQSTVDGQVVAEMAPMHRFDPEE